ncbi:MAG: Ku protein [Spirochaetota bacterium]
MAQTIWIGNIHFKDTDIPVKLHTSVTQKRIQFHLLHKTDRIRLRQQMICAYEKIPVTGAEEVKGFKVDERKYILMDSEELEETEPEKNRMIEVHEFVKAGEIDPVFMERTYYLEPGMANNKNYGLLVDILKDTGLQGICTWAMRKRAYFGAVKSDGKMLRLTTLRYADEIIKVKDLGIEAFSLSEKELEIAGELIGKLTVHFQPEKYKNEHQQKLQELIEKKARGEKLVLLKPRKRKTTPSGKLLEVLEESLRMAR